MDINKAVGWISLVFGILILGSILLMFAGVIPYAGNPITTILMLIGFFYTFYKTILKNAKLTKGEWVAIAVLLFLFFLPFFLL
jgi:cobalamin biosynthesis protein CobD/CbiB